MGEPPRSRVRAGRSAIDPSRTFGGRGSGTLGKASTKMRDVSFYDLVGAGEDRRRDRQTK
jgi:hypothetical protein